MTIRKLYSLKWCMLFFITLFCLSTCYVLDLMFFINDIVGYLAKLLHIPTSYDVLQNIANNVLVYDEKNCKYLINNPGVCVPNLTFLAVLVKSAPKHFEQRKAIRESWGNISRWNISPFQQVIVLFSIGVDKKRNEDDLQKKLNEENKLFADLIQENFLEDFHNLTRKIVSQIKWMKEFCARAKYFMSTDDDVFVNIRNVVNYLSEVDSQDLYLGCVHSGSSPIRDMTSKYHVPRSIYSGLYYPDYCAGAGYVLSSHAVQLIYEQIASVPMLYIDDVYVGILVKKAGVLASDSAQFFCESKVPHDPCYYDYFITSHSYTPEKLGILMDLVSQSMNSGYCCSVKLLMRKLFH